MKYIVVCHPKVRNKYYVTREGIGMHYVVAEALGEDTAKQICRTLNAEFEQHKELHKPIPMKKKRAA